MAESYFDWLTEQQGLPAKPFDPLEELKQLRRKLASRLQTAGLPVADAAVVQPVFESKTPENLPVAGETQKLDPLELALETVANMKQTLASCRQSSQRPKMPRSDTHRVNHRNQIFRGKPLNSKETVPTEAEPAALPAAAGSNLNVPKDSILETVNAGLMALGIIGIVFGLLSFYRGWESDLSFGTLASASGAAIVVIGLGGRLFAGD